MLDKLRLRLKEQKVELLQELDAKVSAELIEMRGEIHNLKVENDELKKRVAELEATSVSKKRTPNPCSEQWSVRQVLHHGGV